MDLRQPPPAKQPLGTFAKTPHTKHRELPDYNNTVHNGIMCDACATKPITGMRYKCVRCADYDLCGACFDAGTEHPHGFVNVQVPKHPNCRNPREPRFDATPAHPGVICDSCGAFVKGIRYKCGNCLNFDFCAACEEKGNHDSTHIFLKIRSPIAWSPVDNLLPALYTPNPPTNGTYAKSNSPFVRAYCSPQEKRTEPNDETRLEESGAAVFKMECSKVDSLVEEMPEKDMKPILAEGTFHEILVPKGGENATETTATELTSSCVKQDQQKIIVSSAESSKVSSEESSEESSEDDEMSTDGEPMLDQSLKIQRQQNTTVTNEFPAMEKDPGNVVDARYVAELLDESDPTRTWIAPGLPFIKSWTVKNTGTCTWPRFSFLMQVGGENRRCPVQVNNKMVQPGESTTIYMNIRTPMRTGKYSRCYRMSFVPGYLLGPHLYCRLKVVLPEIRPRTAGRSTRKKQSPSTTSSTESFRCSADIDSASSSIANGISPMEDSCTIEFPSPACSWPYSDTDSVRSPSPVSIGHESDGDRDEEMEIVSVSSRGTISMSVGNLDEDVGKKDGAEARNEGQKVRDSTVDDLDVKLSMLEDMGFNDRVKNTRLLSEKNNNLQSVVQLLLA